MRNLIYIAAIFAALLSTSNSFAVDTCRADTSPSAATSGTDAPLSCDPATRALRTTATLSPGGTVTANQGTAGSSAWPVKTTPNATAATTTTVLAGADATVCAADATSAERVMSNNGSATAYVKLGAAAASGVGIPVGVGATYVEDRYSGAIHAFGTGSFDCQKVTP